MSNPLTRRDALKRLGTVGAGIILGRGIIRGQYADIMVSGKPVEIAVSSLNPATVRITVLPLTDGRAAPVPVDGALMSEAEGRALARNSIREHFGPIHAGNLVVRFTAEPPTIQIETRTGRPVQRLTLDANAAGMSFLLSKGPLLGLGPGGPQFDRKGTTDRMRSGQGGYNLGTNGGRVPIQWLVGTDGWGMFIHQPLGTFDFTGSEGKFAAPNDGLPLDVFVVSSSDPAEIMREYARITGLAEMPALWTLGYMQSSRTLAGPEEIMGVASTMREKKLPCDALIYLGTEFCPSGWNTRNGEFTWHSGNFPDPKGMIDKLHGQHFKVVLHIVIEGHLLPGTVKEPCDPKNAVPSGRTPDNQWPDSRNVACYWPYHKSLYDVGVDGWWPDQGDGYDAPSRLNRNRMYWEGSQLWRPNERPFALHRNGYAGMQRYAAFLWSGDVNSRWETLRTHVPVAVNAGLSGIPYWGTDIGGFIPTQEYTGELHVRWFQFGAFCTCFRAHGRRWHLRLPWGWNGGDGGPVDETPNYKPDPAELNNPLVEPILKKYLELRYRLLPYTYTAVRECCETGLPILRSLWLHYPGDPAAVARGDQYLWGRDILVSPVVEKGATSRRLYLPRGAWFDFWTEERVEGGREIDRKVDLETMPLHVRAGAILPLGPVRQYADEPTGTPMTLIVYPGADGTATLYEDDGKTFDYRKGIWMRIEMGWHNAERRLTLRLAKGSRMLPPAKRSIEVRIAGERAARTVVFEGRPVEVRL
ncbi:MAG: TIM-barrel domain-containing protein [Acidobacteriota bacterium]